MTPKEAVCWVQALITAAYELSLAGDQKGVSFVTTWLVVLCHEA